MKGLCWLHCYSYRPVRVTSGWRSSFTERIVSTLVLLEGSQFCNYSFWKDLECNWIPQHLCREGQRHEALSLNQRTLHRNESFEPERPCVCAASEGAALRQDRSLVSSCQIIVVLIQHVLSISHVLMFTLCLGPRVNCVKQTKRSSAPLLSCVVWGRTMLTC